MVTIKVSAAIVTSLRWLKSNEKKSHNLHDVFTPNKPAFITFVERDNINNKLVRALQTPGKQVVVYGHSGSGKSTLLLNKLHQTYENHITTPCLSDTTFDQLILDAFDQLDPYYCSEKVNKRKDAIDASLQSEYIGIKSQVNSKTITENEKKETRLLPPQLTPQRLARFIGSTGWCWVIEDFHKVDEEHKKKLAEMMKLFVDLSVEFSNLKIVALGAVSTAREVVQCESNMKGRVSEIHVPLMNDIEILKILEIGESKLNISFPDSFKNDIKKYSNGLAMVCHQLALNACDAAEIRSTSNSRRVIKVGEFALALQNYVEDEGDTLQAIFDSALKQKRKRKYDNCRIILENLAHSKKDVGYTKSELLEMIRKTYPDYPPGNLTLYLEELQSDERSAIIRFDASSEKYDYTNQFHKVFAKLILDNPSNKKPKISITSESLSSDRMKIILKTIESVSINIAKTWGV